MIRFVFLCSLFLGAALNARASVFVGNGGEGIRVGEKIYLRDLYDYGNHLNPVIGPQTDLLIFQRVKNLPISQFNVSLPLLARKITDLQNLSPQLGYYVISAISYFQWVLIDTPLNQFEDDGSPLDTLERRVPLANRFQSVIRIHRPSWDLLDDENKVALIIHEAFFALLTPARELNGLFFQHDYKARELVGRAFSGSSGPSYFLTQTMEDYLVIPAKYLRRSCGHGFFSVRIQVFDQIFDRVVFSEDLRDYVEVPAIETRRSLFSRACSVIAGRKNARVNMDVYRDPWKLIELPYPTIRTGKPYEQLLLGIIHVPGYDQPAQNEDWSGLTRSECEVLFEANTNAWFRYHSGTLDSNPLFSCQMMRDQTSL